MLRAARASCSTYFPAKVDAKETDTNGNVTAWSVIDFNPNGYIGFCPEADDENTKPVIEAFVNWCDWLKKSKEVTQ